MKTIITTKRGHFMKHRFFHILSIVLIIIICGSIVNAQENIDNTIYASLLKKYIVGVRVNYDGLKKDEKILDEYLNLLSVTDIKSLPLNTQFAYYINVYNAFTLKLILTQYPGINSIKEIGGFFSNPWKKKFIPLQGKTVNLDYIEHQVLRPKFKDPRVHFAINCASKSCPPLRNEPYEAKQLEKQLDEQAHKFINDKKHNYFKDDQLYLSKIFKWFKVDFNNNPSLFIKQYADNDLKEKLNGHSNLKIGYLEYNWALNQ